MKELSELKNEFYEVMYKYEKSFSEKGVMADLTAWQTAKADLISLLRCHPDWNETEQAIIFDCNQALSIQPESRRVAAPAEDARRGGAAAVHGPDGAGHRRAVWL